MEGAYKKFDKALYKKYDESAKDRTKKFLRSRGYEVKDHPNKYAQDLVATKDESEFLVECEVKLVWDKPKLPFDTIQLPERKKKFFKKRTVFFIWNKALDDAIYFWSDHVKHIKPIEVKNKFVKSGELFYQIPLDKTNQVSKL